MDNNRLLNYFILENTSPFEYYTRFLQKKNTRNNDRNNDKDNNDKDIRFGFAYVHLDGTFCILKWAKMLINAKETVQNHENDIPSSQRVPV